MINWITRNKWYLIWFFIAILISYLIQIITVRINRPHTPIDNTTKIDSLVNVISVKDGQIIQLEQDYSELEQLKTQTRVKYRDKIIKVREGDVLVVFEDLRCNL